MARVQTGLVVGRTRVADENRHLLGPVEGSWWKWYSWWVIPLGILLFVYPGWATRGLWWGTEQLSSWWSGPPALGPGPSGSSTSSTTTSTTSSIVVPPVPPTVKPPVPVVVTPSVVMTSPPSVIRVEVPKIEVEVKSPPPSPLVPADPTANMTPEERRQYRVWVLRE